jgi:hypothetical protein
MGMMRGRLSAPNDVLVHLTYAARPGTKRAR